MKRFLLSLFCIGFILSCLNATEFIKGEELIWRQFDWDGLSYDPRIDKEAVLVGQVKNRRTYQRICTDKEIRYFMDFLVASGHENVRICLEKDEETKEVKWVVLIKIRVD